MSTLMPSIRQVALVVLVTTLKCIDITSCARLSTSISTQVPGYKYTSWHHGVICHAAHKPLKPTTLADLERAVAQARAIGYTLKATGSHHSANDIICTDGIPVNMHAINHFRYDKRTQLATAGAGITLHQFLEHLHDNGRTVYGIPTLTVITLGGILATGSHGSEHQHPATLSDQLVGMVVVDGLGNVHNITDRQRLRAFQTHLGLLGLVYEVTFKTIPQYKIHIRNYPQPESILWKNNEIMRIAKSNERLQFFWFPLSKRVILSVGNHVPVSTRGNCKTMFMPDSPLRVTGLISETMERMQEGLDHLGYYGMERFVEHSLHTHVAGKSPMFTTNGKTFCQPAIGYSHRMLTNKCRECPWTYGNSSVFQFEFAAIIPLTELSGAVQSIREILKEHPIEFPLTGIFFRFVSPSDGLVTVSSGQASVSVEWVLVPRKDRFNKPMMGLPSSQAITQALIFKHKGRPHWAKGGQLYFYQELLFQRFPQMPTFVKYMERFDPNGIFLNDFGRRLRFGSKKTSLDSYAKHCGLVDGCVCQNDSDCGDGSLGSYKCGTILTYSVCKENDRQFKVSRSKSTIRYLAGNG